MDEIYVILELPDDDAPELVSASEAHEVDALLELLREESSDAGFESWCVEVPHEDVFTDSQEIYVVCEERDSGRLVPCWAFASEECAEECAQERSEAEQLNYQVYDVVFSAELEE